MSLAIDGKTSDDGKALSMDQLALWHGAIDELALLHKALPESVNRQLSEAPTEKKTER